MTSNDPACLFLSDVHLSPDQPAKTERFVAFLRDVAGRIDALYILGDLFDYWIGPQHVGMPDYRAILGAFRAHADRGLRIAFVPGNRDYKVGPELARATRMEILPARADLRLGGRRVRLEHGDFLFNRNPRYTAYRRIAGARGARRLWAGIPTSLAFWIASGVRAVSRKDTPKAPFRTDADLLGAARPAFGQGVDVLVCGHLHRAADLRAEVDGRGRRLIVLGEWEPERNYARYEKGEFRLI